MNRMGVAAVLLPAAGFLAAPAQADPGPPVYESSNPSKGEEGTAHTGSGMSDHANDHSRDGNAGDHDDHGRNKGHHHKRGSAGSPQDGGKHHGNGGSEKGGAGNGGGRPPKSKPNDLLNLLLVLLFPAGMGAIGGRMLRRTRVKAAG